jgi:hypothetical protein
MTTRPEGSSKVFGAFVAAVLIASCGQTSAQSVTVPRDPGVRGGAAGAGGPLQGLTTDESAFFRDGLASSLRSRSSREATTMGWGLASTPTSACLAIRSRLPADQALRGTP